MAARDILKSAGVCLISSGHFPPRLASGRVRIKSIFWEKINKEKVSAFSLPL
jgi:hypothetical protein